MSALEPRIVGQPLRHVRLLNAFLLRTAEPPITQVEGRIVRDLRTDSSLQQSLLDVLRHADADSAVSVRAVPFQQSHHGNFAHPTRAGNHAGFLSLVHEARFPADIGFVRLDLSAHLGKGTALHRETNPVQQEPCSLLGDA